MFTITRTTVTQISLHLPAFIVVRSHLKEIMLKAMLANLRKEFQADDEFLPIPEEVLLPQRTPL